MNCFLTIDQKEYWLTDQHKDIEGMLMLLSQTYWGHNRPKSLLEKAIKNSHCFSIFDGDLQVGMARIISDEATFAYFSDVVIHEGYRGKGLGAWLLQSILALPEYQEIKRWSLITKDAQEFYLQFGFQNLEDSRKYMEIFSG